MPLMHPPEPPSPVVQPTAVFQSASAGTRWEGALGLSSSLRPAYAGAGAAKLSTTPVFYLRYGRLSISSGSGFVRGSGEEVERGAALDLLRGDHMKLGLALRFDRGRPQSSSAALTGLGSIAPTARLRLGWDWRLNAHWRLGASWSVDASGRGGGHLGDVGLGYETRPLPGLQLQAATALSMAGDRYLQTYYGISREQAARTGYALYTPAAGLRDWSVGLGLRMQLDSHWVLQTNLGWSRLLGPAAQSPLTREVGGLNGRVGLAFRF